MLLAPLVNHASLPKCQPAVLTYSLCALDILSFAPVPALPGIPVSTSHICVFAAVAVGLFEGRRGVNWLMVLQVGA